VADEKIDIAAEVAGKVLVLNVDVGTEVRMGDILLEQDRAVLEARRAQAQAALQAAAAQLELLRLPADDSALAAAQAAVSAAAARYQSAVDGPTAEDLRTAEAQLRQAQAFVTQAQAAYNLVKDRNDIGALPQSMQLEQATLQVEAAQAQYDKLVKGATDDQIAAAYAQLSQARDQQARLLAGAKEPQIAIAQAQVHQAEGALYLAQVELEKATVLAPMDGVVAAVYTALGAQALPGARLFTLQSLPVHVEVPVEEARLAQLRVGQPAEIRVNAYPGQVFAGEIAIIAPALDPATRTVQVTIRPTDNANLLRPGMFADVTLLE
jgi:multidrug resistance efflux pump